MVRLAPLAAAIAMLVASSCSQEERAELPTACKTGPAAVERALAAAPGEVRIDGTPLSRCLQRRSDQADVQQVGATFVTVAGRLAAVARARPDGPEAVRLGYLMGAARRGGGRTQGIHLELLRRLDQELTVVDTGSAAFRRGERAGRERG